MSKWSEAFKTILFYLGGLLGFVLLTFWFTASGRYEEENIELSADIAQPRQAAPTATPWPKTPTPIADPAAEGCRVTPGSARYGYLPDAPFTTTLASPELQRRGQPLVISGIVYASDCRTPLPDVLIEVWQANPEGVYDWSGDFVLRGQLRTDVQGRYRFTTVKPGRYVTGTEPLPAHIHYRVSYGDQAILFTQLFFAGDPFLTQFPFVRSSLIISLTQSGTVRSTGEFKVVLPVTAQTPKPRRAGGY